ncbi:hypothetical protein cyc_03936 [Cyclospora cayetanensis]|uniref:Uncharacterized protein n=1 Tax=Cyclospora cayetanensis TaxID=88456 RepID=A0A1D3D2K6_9EIME|nr:hypothetical protein cyc_03936 [Cyclospora cayetanensis]
MARSDGAFAFQSKLFGALQDSESLIVPVKNAACTLPSRSGEGPPLQAHPAAVTAGSTGNSDSATPSSSSDTDDEVASGLSSSYRSSVCEASPKGAGSPTERRLPRSHQDRKKRRSSARQSLVGVASPAAADADETPVPATATAAAAATPAAAATKRSRRRRRGSSDDGSDRGGEGGRALAEEGVGRSRSQRKCRRKWKQFYESHQDRLVAFNSFSPAAGAALLLRVIPGFSLQQQQICVEVGHGSRPLAPHLFVECLESRFQSSAASPPSCCCCSEGAGASNRCGSCFCCVAATDSGRFLLLECCSEAALSAIGGTGNSPWPLWEATKEEAAEAEVAALESHSRVEPRTEKGCLASASSPLSREARGAAECDAADSVLRPFSAGGERLLAAADVLRGASPPPCAVKAVYGSGGDMLAVLKYLHDVGRLEFLRMEHGTKYFDCGSEERELEGVPSGAPGSGGGSRGGNNGSLRFLAAPVFAYTHPSLPSDSEILGEEVSPASPCAGAAASAGAAEAGFVGCGKYVVLKSTLDSFCCLLPLTGSLDWKDDLRIPRVLVHWFDSLSLLLQQPAAAPPAAEAGDARGGCVKQPSPTEAQHEQRAAAQKFVSSFEPQNKEEAARPVASARMMEPTGGRRAGQRRRGRIAQHNVLMSDEEAEEGVQQLHQLHQRRSARGRPQRLKSKVAAERRALQQQAEMYSAQHQQHPLLSIARSALHALPGYSPFGSQALAAGWPPYKDAEQQCHPHPSYQTLPFVPPPGTPPQSV